MTKQANKRFRLTPNHYQTVFNHLAEGVVVKDKKNCVLDINETALKMIGLKKSQALGKRCNQIFTCERGEHHCFMRHVLATGETIKNQEETLLDGQGKAVNVIVTASPIRNKQGIIVGGVQIFRNIDEIAQINRACQIMSLTDELTRLTNRRGLFRQFDIEIARVERHKKPLSLLMLDLDNFKRYNDTYGHPAGDELLKLIGRILKDASRTGDLPARYGGEEFMVLLPETKPQEARTYAERIRIRVASETRKIHPEAKSVTVSIGISYWVGNGKIPQSLYFLAAADTALYRAKRQGKNRVVLARPLTNKMNSTTKTQRALSKRKYPALNRVGI